MRKVIIYDWNKKISVSNRKKKIIELNDETLRDGLQGTYVLHPSLKNKIKLLDAMEQLQIESCNIGFPISGQEATKDIISLVHHAQKNKYKIKLECGARVLLKDVQAIIDSSQKSGSVLGAGLFIASSNIRHIVEKWDLKRMGKMIKESVSLAVKNGLPVMFVTEDTTRAHPKTIEYLYSQAIDSGASRICVCDTVGHANPWSTFQLVLYIKNNIVRNQKIAIDWHGHNDRGLAVANSLAAAFAGVDRIQATALGVGERAGNTSMTEILLNLQLEGMIHKNLKYVNLYNQIASQILGVPILPHQPIIGSGVFKTATGVHAAAIKKAIEMDNENLAGIIYTSIDPRILGRDHEILIGPLSGKANVEWVLEKLGIPANEDIINYLLQAAKFKRKILLEKEILEILDNQS